MSPDQAKVIKYWRESAERDIESARDLVKLKHFHWALFVYHLAIEKLLKGLLVKIGITPPRIHDLERLAEIAQLQLSDEYRDWLKEVTKYNIAARYDEEKFLFYKKATPQYTSIWAKRCEEIFTWLKHQFD